MFYAAQENKVKVVNMLLRTRQTRRLIDVPDRTDVFPLHVAASQGHLEVIREFLRVDIDLYCRDDSENTPLHLAAQSGHVE